MEQIPTPNDTVQPAEASLPPKPLEQPYYVPVVPQEPKNANPGRAEGIISIIFALLSIGFLPPVFGIAGIVLGVQSRRKGRKTFGTVAIALSIVFMIAGIVWGAYANIKNHSA